MHIEATDPAMELHELLGILLQQQPTNKPTWQVISSATGISSANCDYNDFLTAAISRIQGLKTLAEGVSGSEKLVLRAQRVLGTTDRLMHIFLPLGQSAPWLDSHGRISIADATNLSSFSPFARQVRPLRLIESTDRDAFLKAIDEAIAEIHAAPEVDPWLRPALAREAKRLRTTLEHVDYFGHEFVIERTAVVSIKTAEIVHASPHVSERLVKTLNMVAMITAVFTAPHDVKEASGEYLTWARQLPAQFSHNSEPTTKSIGHLATAQPKIETGE